MCPCLCVFAQVGGDLTSVTIIMDTPFARPMWPSSLLWAVAHSAKNPCPGGVAFAQVQVSGGPTDYAARHVIGVDSIGHKRQTRFIVNDLSARCVATLHILAPGVALTKGNTKRGVSTPRECK